MDKDKNSVLTDVFCSVLEKQAFMFAEPAELNEIPREIETCVKTQIGYEGAEKGLISMLVPGNMSIQLASNILGIELEDETATEQSEDALKELLNIICGNVITELHGENSDISPTIPTIEILDPDDWKKILAENPLLFTVDEIPVILNI